MLTLSPPTSISIFIFNVGVSGWLDLACVALATSLSHLHQTFASNVIIISLYPPLICYRTQLVDARVLENFSLMQNLPVVIFTLFVHAKFSGTVGRTHPRSHKRQYKCM